MGAGLAEQLSAERLGITLTGEQVRMAALDPVGDRWEELVGALSHE